MKLGDYTSSALCGVGDDVGRLGEERQTVVDGGVLSVVRKTRNCLEWLVR